MFILGITLNQSYMKAGSSIVIPLMSFIFILGLISLVFVVNLYRITLIDINLLLVVMCSLSLITSYFTYPFLIQSAKDASFVKSLFFRLFFVYSYNWVICGGFSVCLFLATNNCFSNEVVVSRQVTIENKKQLPPDLYVKRWTPLIVVQFFEGIKKEVFIKDATYDALAIGDVYNLKLKKGLWGIDVIVSDKA